MAEDIETLREFRDGYLVANRLGQALVDVYYRASPPIARFITEHPRLKPIVRVGLLPAVAISAVAVNVSQAEKMAAAGWFVPIPMALGIWMTKLEVRCSEYT